MVNLKVKIIRPFRVLWGIASVTLLATQLAFADLPREHLSLDAGWKFHLGDDWPDALHPDKAGTSSGPAAQRFNGLAQIIVQSTRAAGEIKLTANANGLILGKVTVQTQSCALRPFVP